MNFAYSMYDIYTQIYQLKK